MEFQKICAHSLIILSMLSIAGCATQPISSSVAMNVPNERVIDSKYSQPAPETGQVTVKRDSGFFGAACSARIFVNAKPVADIRASEKVVLHLSSGDYIFSAWPNGMCGGGMSEVRSTVKVGDDLKFRVGYGSNGDFSINATAF